MRMGLPGRLVIFGLVVVGLFATLLGRLAQVQIGEHTAYVSAAQQANTRTIIEPAVRGRILARDGTPLVANTTSTAVTVQRSTLLSAPDGGRAVIESVASALGRPFDQLWARTSLCGTQGAAPAPACWGGSPYVPIPIAEGVDPTKAIAIAERPDRYPGIALVPEAVRSYPAPVNVAHIVGYLSRANSDDIAASHGALTDQDLVGRAGLEQQYDVVLRGTPGRTVVEIDPRGVVLRTVSRTPPIPGVDLVTNLDVSVQRSAEAALATQIAAARTRGEKADSGAVVVMDSRTGGVVALASYPTYAPSIWVGGISTADYDRLTGSAASTPLLDRAIGATMPPASTFKAISLPAALAAGNSLTGTYDCGSSYVIGGRAFHNFESAAYGRINLTRAMEISCDTIFYEFAYRSWLAQGGLKATTDAADPFVKSARAFGLGERTGIDLPGEVAGRIPDRAWKLKTWQDTKADTCARATSGYPEVAKTDPTRAAYLKALAVENCATGFQFRGGDAANFAIGQGDVSVTPVQMARAFAAIGNGGSLLTPRIAAATVAVGGVRTALPAGPVTSVGLPANVQTFLQSSLRAVVERGTAAGAFAGMPATWPVAGKTGTGEVFGNGDTSWFVSYAPATAPRYAVAAVVNQGGQGALTAAPVSRAVHEALSQLPAR